MLSSVQLVSVLGSLLVLVAYVASQFGWLSGKNPAYAFANIAGSGLLAVVAALESQWGFLLLEGAWVSVSLVAMVRQRVKLNTYREWCVSNPSVATLAWVIRRMQEHRANLTHEDELRFELSKCLVKGSERGKRS
jgi:hypothetical protein